jgi:hypothetical protein
MSDPVVDDEWPEGFFEKVVGGWQGLLDDQIRVASNQEAAIDSTNLADGKVDPADLID